MASTERSGEGSTGTALIVGLVSDTHGVYDPALALELRSASLILHAGDVGHHGLHQGDGLLSYGALLWARVNTSVRQVHIRQVLFSFAEVLAELQKLAPVTAVRWVALHAMRRMPRAPSIAAVPPHVHAAAC